MTTSSDLPNSSVRTDNNDPNITIAEIVALEDSLRSAPSIADISNVKEADGTIRFLTSRGITTSGRTPVADAIILGPADDEEAVPAEKKTTQRPQQRRQRQNNNNNDNSNNNHNAAQVETGPGKKICAVALLAFTAVMLIVVFALVLSDNDGGLSYPEPSIATASPTIHMVPTQSPAPTRSPPYDFQQGGFDGTAVRFDAEYEAETLQECQKVCAFNQYTYGQYDDVFFSLTDDVSCKCGREELKCLEVINLFVVFFANTNYSVCGI
mmetsp:Transcript_13123/g.19903  ORF Transcript_13123/g.19903 Transcript_13123/m.19903 type:complete len:267 (+) Transcript_13123:90-890(+)